MPVFIKNLLKRNSLSLGEFLIVISIFIPLLCLIVATSIDFTYFFLSSLPLNNGIKTLLVEAISLVIQTFGIFFAAGIVIWQTNRQHRSSIELQKESIKDSLKKQLFDEFVVLIKEASNATSDTWGYVMRISVSLVQQKSMKNQGIQFSQMKERAHVISGYHNTLQDSIIKIISIIEKYEIIEPNIKIFQEAFAFYSNNLIKDFFPYYTEVAKVLPLDFTEEIAKQVGTNISLTPMPTDEQIQLIESRSKIYNETLWDIHGVIDDFSKEIQNLLLGRVFDHRVPHRVPTDSSVIVVSTKVETVEKLKEYFKNNWRN